jgi:hypothetical protein
MINKENKQQQVPENKSKPGYLDKARVDVQCHLLIKDRDSGKVLVNKRG